MVAVVDRLRNAGSAFEQVVHKLSKRHLQRLGPLVAAPLSAHLRTATDRMNLADVTVPRRDNQQGKFLQPSSNSRASTVVTANELLKYDGLVRDAEMAIYRLDRSADLVHEQAYAGRPDNRAGVHIQESAATVLASKLMAEARLHPADATRAIQLDSRSRINRRIEELQHQFRADMQVCTAGSTQTTPWVTCCVIGCSTRSSKRSRMSNAGKFKGT